VQFNFGEILPEFSGGINMLKKMVLVLVFLLSLTAAAFAAVNINTADEEALIALPYIGPAKAAAIIEYRKDIGKFDTVDDLTKVRGVGVKTLEKLRDLISLKD
jgi:competence protein ComEA